MYFQGVFVTYITRISFAKFTTNSKIIVQAYSKVTLKRLLNTEYKKLNAAENEFAWILPSTIFHELQPFSDLDHFFI